MANTYDLINEFLEERANEIIQEGANTDLADNMKALKAEMKVVNKDYREAMKKKDFSGALKELDKLDSVIDKYEDSIDKIDSNIGEVVLGIICREFVAAIKAILIGMAVNLTVGDAEGNLGSAAGSLAFAYDNIKTIYGLIKTVSTNGEITVSDLNLYKQSFKGSIEVMRKLNDMKRDIVKNKMDKAKEVKESVDSLKLNVYEAAESGLISDEDKNDIISALNEISEL